MRIGFIGMGIMGSRMAMNLLKAGFELTVFNRTKEKAKKIIANGAGYSDNLFELAEESDVIITMLSTPEVVEKIALGNSGFANYLKIDSIWMDSTTVDPKTSTRFSKFAKTNGFHFLDAPVAGSLKPAESGELLFLIGGKEKEIEVVKPLIEAMGRGYLHAGEAGKGSAMKMVLNLLMGQAMATFSESMHLAESLGIEKDIVLDTIMDMPMVAPILKLKKENFRNEIFDTEFPLKWMTKDIYLACNCGYESGISMPVSNAVKSLFEQAKHKGNSELDFSSVYEFVKRK